MAASSAIFSVVAFSLSSESEIRCGCAPTQPSPFAVNFQNSCCRRRRREFSERLQCLSPGIEVNCRTSLRRNTEVICRTSLRKEHFHGDLRPKLHHRLQKYSPFSDVGSESRSKCTSSSVVASFSVVDGDGSEAGMTEEEKNAIMEFAGLSSDEIEKIQDESQSSPEEERKLEPTAETANESASIERQPEEARSIPPTASRHGSEIANAITLYATLLERSASGDGRMIANAGSVVLERVEEEVKRLREVDGVNIQYLFEVLRVAKLLQMDLQLIGASRKSSTLSERVDETKMHCKQMLDITAAL